jgi:hypothetical protein
MSDVVCRVMEVMGDASVDANEGCSTQTDRNAFNKHKKKKNLCLLDLVAVTSVIIMRIVLRALKWKQAHARSYPQHCRDPMSTASLVLLPQSIRVNI